MKSAQADSRDFDAGFSQGAVGHLSVNTLALTTSPGNFGCHRHGRQPADEFASLDIVPHHFLSSFIIHFFCPAYFPVWLRSRVAAAMLLDKLGGFEGRRAMGSCPSGIHFTRA